MRIFFFFCFSLALFIAGPAGAQLTQDDVLSPNNPQSCSDKVTAESLIEGSALAFTGRALKVSDPYIWFRVHVIHSGSFDGHIVKAAGFEGGKGFFAGAGQSYEEDKAYTIVMRPPASEHERNLKVDYINALDSCGESVVSKVHDRYGIYRIKKEDLEPEPNETFHNHLYFYRTYYMILLAFIGCMVLGVGYSVFEKRLKRR